MEDKKLLDLGKTKILSKDAAKEDNEDRHTDCPVLFVCQGKTISEHRLEGRQEFGRPADGVRPDISINNHYVSRKHGIFETEQGTSWYTALETTNPTKYMGRPLSNGDRIRLRDGDELVITYETDGEEGSVLLIIANSSSRVSLWRELQQAFRDELTMLYGRAGFLDWWIQNREGDDYRQAAVFLMDVDCFKKINDTKGHKAGDAVLKIVAEELRKTVRYDNQVCRWGGDEFLGVLPGTRDQVEERLGDLGRRISTKTADDGIPVTVSIGYVHCDNDGRIAASELESLVELADKGLYRVKEEGRNGICGYQDTDHTADYKRKE